jgi:hypothetical protein
MSAMFPARDGILVGYDVHSGKSEYVSLADMKTTSTHVIGASGYGKSFFLRNLISQFVSRREPFGVVCPHGELCRYALWRLRRAGVPASKIVLLDPGDTRYALSFDPLRAVPDAGDAASLVVEAFTKAWGAQSFDAMPRLEGILRGMARLLIDGGLTLLEGYDVLNIDNLGLRRALRDRVGDRMVREDWAEFEKLPRTEKLAVVESTRNRLRRVLQAAPLQAMLGQRHNTLDLQQVLDDGKYLIVNLGSIAAPETQRLIGALVVNALYHCARRRDTRRPRSWFFICDEFGEFATRDFASSLDQLRKFGVHLVLAHQRLRQLEREDADVLSAVMTNAKLKVVFGGLERSESERMARELFTGQVSGDQVKHISTGTRFRPVEDTFVVETESAAESESDSESWSQSSGASSGSDDSESLSFQGFESDVEPEAMHHGRTRSRHESSSTSESGGGGHGTTTTSGWSRSVVPITRHEEFTEETGRQFYSIEEEWERHVAIVHGLPRRHALIKVLHAPVMHITTPDMQVEQQDGRYARFQIAVQEECPSATAVSVVQLQIEERREEVLALGESGDTNGRPVPAKSFRE